MRYYFLLLSKKQIHEFVLDAFAANGCHFASKDCEVVYNMTIQNDNNELKVECVTLIKDFEQSEGVENTCSISELAKKYQDSDFNYIYYHIGEKEVKTLIVSELNKLKMCKSLIRKPTSIKFFCQGYDDLRCLVLFGKSTIDAQIEKAILELCSASVNGEDLKIHKISLKN